MKTKRFTIALLLTAIAGPGLLCSIPSLAAPKKNVVDEVAWVVGDEPIYRSDVEDMYAQMRSEGSRWP